jgi:formate dehydrogenase subunit gamma
MSDCTHTIGSAGGRTLPRRLFTGLAVYLFAVFVTLGTIAPVVAQTEGRTVKDESPVAGNVPGGHLGIVSDADIWKEVRSGLQGQVSIPNKQSGVLIQSEGDNWRAWRNGPLTVFGAWGLLGILGIVALFFAVLGRIRIDSGTSGRTVERFNMVERVTHWVTASSFIILALTGLNLLYGRHVLLPVLGPDAFALLATGGKYAHNFLSFAFMLGVVMMFVLWVRHNIPDGVDLKWLAKGGGLLIKGVHPPAKKFNAGQKFIFWCVIIGGLLVSLSGLSLLFPFQLPMFAPTFEVLNAVGFDLPTDLTMLEEMQLSQLWHAAIGLVLIVIVFGHIYIGSLGMQGAFDAMGSGQVDENWAREHHSIWMAELKKNTDAKPSGKAQPAE